MPETCQNVEAIIRELRKQQSELSRYGVRHLALFGSTLVAPETAKDIDILVEFDAPPAFAQFMNLKFFLEDLLGKPVDLLSRSACKDRFYQRIKADLLHVA